MPKPVLKKNYGLWLIWLLPVIAGLIGAWLVYQDIHQAAIEITISFSNAEGLKEEKTKIIYKGIVVGKVKSLHISEDMQHVRVVAEMNHDVVDALNAGTRFWLVKPKVSLTGVTGLDTLVSGNYIRMQPGQGKSRRHFDALPKAPVQDEDTPGLYITLLAEQLGSLDRGSLIYYREIPVGEVQDFALTEHQDGVALKVRIDEQYMALVKGSTRFWNASGISLKASVKGLELKTGTLASVIAGGIAFTTPDPYVANPASNGETFELYPDYESAEVGIAAKIRFDSALSVIEGMEIKYDGYQIGSVKRLGYPTASGESVAEVSFDPRAEKLLREGTRFWVEKPKLSLSGVTGLETLIQGTYINTQVGDGKPTRDFKALDKPLPGASESGGLRVVLQADELGSIERHSPVLYKKIQVGDVRDYRLAKSGKHILIDIQIYRDYRHLVGSHSRFWNASGVQVNAQLTGLQVRTGSMETLLNGGIEFITPDGAGNTVDDGQVFPLYADYAGATQNGLLVRKSSPGSLALSLRSEQLGGLTVGSKVYFQKVPVGAVAYYELLENGEVAIHVDIERAYRHLVKPNSRFWRSGGVALEAGLSGVKLKTEALAAVVNGGVSFDSPGGAASTGQARTSFPLYEDFNAAEQAAGTRLQIHFALADGIDKGTAIKYRGVKVGELTRVALAENRQGIVADAVLYGFAKDFARRGTQFWLIGPSLGLFHTEHLGTLLQGKYIEVRPGQGAASSVFQGQLQAPEVTGGLRLVLRAKRLGSLKTGNPVYYRQVPVGVVTGFHLADDATSVLVELSIEARYAPLVRDNSLFWNVSGVDVDYGLWRGLKVTTESLEAIATGGVAFATPQQAPQGQALPGSVFELHEQAEDEWLQWAPTIALPPG